jgi:predicted AAA+ superfamily ATPase
MLPRLINPLLSNSFFLFGSRGTGKTSWLRENLLHLPGTLYLDLLSAAVEEEFAKSPDALSRRLDAFGSLPEWVVIDEVQRVPKLLDIVHREIESRKVKFALTGSSARKLRRGGANLLAGRAFINELFPFTYQELGKSFLLETVLSWGSLPAIIGLNSAEARTQYLEAYAQTYLREEVIAEQLVRNVSPFRFFLEIAAQQSGKLINYSEIASQLSVDPKTIKTYFEILEDTLLGFSLPAYHRSIRKQQRQSPKFFLFDMGVKRALERTLAIPLRSSTSAFGDAFEHYLILECHRLHRYLKRDFRLSYLQTKDGAEIDLIVERPGDTVILLEIKSTEVVEERHIERISRFAKDFPNSLALCASRDPNPKRFGLVHALPWQEALRSIFN